LTQVAFLS